MSAVLAFGLAAGCGDGIGETCAVSGSVDVCGADLLCAANSVLESQDGMDTVCRIRNVCLATCTAQTDCGDGEVCRATFEGTQTTCQVGPAFAVSDMCTVIQR